MVHNYYIAENDGQLSMIAWDYNLAFGGMGGRMGGFGTDGKTNEAADTATQYVNYPIDDPLLAGSMEDKPMISWIFENEEYLEYYHEVYAEYVEYFTSGRFAEMYDSAISLISAYVQKDPTAFCTYEEFQTGSTELREFCMFRAESIGKQLNGTIASTSDGQTETNNANFVDASGVDMESMGSNSMGFGNARGGQFGRFGNNNAATETDGSEEEMPVVGNNSDAAVPDMTEAFTSPDGAQGFPADGAFPQINGRDEIIGGGNVPENANGDNAELSPPDRGMPISTSETSALSLSNLIGLGVCSVLLIGGILFARKRK